MAYNTFGIGEAFRCFIVAIVALLVLVGGLTTALVLVLL